MRRQSSWLDMYKRSHLPTYSFVWSYPVQTLLLINMEKKALLFLLLSFNPENNFFSEIEIFFLVLNFMTKMKFVCLFFQRNFLLF